MRESTALFTQPNDEGIAYPCRRVKALAAGRGGKGDNNNKMVTNDNDLQRGRGREREPLCMGCAVTVVAA